MKKTISLLLSLLLLLQLCACSLQQAPTPQATDTQVFTDSLGRQVTLPAKIDKVAASGTMAQIVLFSLCPDKLVGWATQWDERTYAYLDEQYRALPTLGQLYGGKGDFNLETLLSSGAQVVIDIGEANEGTAQDLDELQAQTGIPFLHIHATTDTIGETYRTLGAILQMPQEAEALATYCEEKNQWMHTLMNSVTPAKVVYCLGDKGLNVIAKGSYHAEILDAMTDNLAVLDAPTSRGTGNEVDMEQLLLWNPEVLLFSYDSIGTQVLDDPLWQHLDAVKAGRVYQVPYGPYNWMGTPPSVQRYLGMLWLADTLYGETAQLDLYREVAEHFSLFYHCDLTQEEFAELIGA